MNDCVWQSCNELHPSTMSITSKLRSLYRCDISEPSSARIYRGACVCACVSAAAARWYWSAEYTAERISRACAQRERRARTYRGWNQRPSRLLVAHLFLLSAVFLRRTHTASEWASRTALYVPLFSARFYNVLFGRARESNMV